MQLHKTVLNHPFHINIEGPETEYTTQNLFFCRYLSYEIQSVFLWDYTEKENEKFFFKL